MRRAALLPVRRLPPGPPKPLSPSTTTKGEAAERVCVGAQRYWCGAGPGAF